MKGDFGNQMLFEFGRSIVNKNLPKIYKIFMRMKILKIIIKNIKMMIKDQKT
jgi:hypothetical protein